MSAVKKWLHSGVTVAVVMAASMAFSVARAGDVFISETGLRAGQATGSLVLPVGTNNYWAGLLTIAVKTDPGSASATSFAAYCIDPAHFSTSAYTSFFAPSPVTTTFTSQASAIQMLFNQYYAGTVNNNANAAAFQLALWEIATDDGNLTTGNVRINAVTTAGLVGNANLLLNGVRQMGYTGPNLYELNVYRADRAVAGSIGQDYIVASATAATDLGGALPVPEPQSFLMILAGLGLMTFLPRLRRPA